MRHSEAACSRRLSVALMQATGALSLVLFGACAGSAKTTGPVSIEAIAASPASGVALRLDQLGGSSVDLASYRGKLLVLSCFTTWCLSCQAEARDVNVLHDQVDPNRVQFLGIAQDVGNRALLRTYVQYVGFTFPVLLAAPDHPEFAQVLGKTQALPRTLVIDAGGVVRLDQQGRTDFDAVRRLLPRASPPR